MQNLRLKTPILGKCKSRNNYWNFEHFVGNWQCLSENRNFLSGCHAYFLSYGAANEVVKLTFNAL